MDEKKKNLNEFMFSVRASQIKKKPKTKFYWQIVKERIELIQSALKPK
jgi:hypothetical protein